MGEGETSKQETPRPTLPPASMQQVCETDMQKEGVHESCKSVEDMDCGETASLGSVSTLTSLEDFKPPMVVLDTAGEESDQEGDHSLLVPLKGLSDYTALPAATDMSGVLGGPREMAEEQRLRRGASAPLLDTKRLPESHSFTLPMGHLGFVDKANLSETNSMIMPICRICHMPEEESNDLLISPCRCSGSLAYIHNRCLMRWLEITSKKSRKPPKCELCHYQYHRHKKFKFHHWHLPRISPQDKILHVIFIINLLIMIGCAIATVMCFLSDNGQVYQNFPKNKVDLTTEEIITLSCGVLFFVSFFIAMSVQIKAKHTIYQLFVKFIMQNMEWEIDEYDKSKDSLYKPPIYV